MPTWAQSNPLKVILPVGPGSGVDVIVRSAQAALSKALNDQAVVIENIAGAGGITGLDSFLKNPAAQNLTQQNLMSSGLATASALGVPLDVFNAKELGGIASVFAENSAASTDWIRGQLPPDKQAEFDAKFKEAQFAVGTAEQKLNDAVLQQAPPGEAFDTVDRITVDAASNRIVGNDKVPDLNYGS
jgi:tripartite-type tricarboxylate transporter receptor subunit TctC